MVSIDGLDDLCINLEMPGSASTSTFFFIINHALDEGTANNYLALMAYNLIQFSW